MEKCKSCIHYGVCKFQGYYDVLNLGGCGDFEDKDLFIKLPCKIGDPLYILVRESPAFGEAHIQEDEATEVSTEGRVWSINCYWDSDDIGRVIFFSREEAEEALKRWRENHD